MSRRKIVVISDFIFCWGFGERGVFHLVSPVDGRWVFHLTMYLLFFSKRGVRQMHMGMDIEWRLPPGDRFVDDEVRMGLLDQCCSAARHHAAGQPSWHTS
jgi:hypothetical protein